MIDYDVIWEDLLERIRKQPMANDKNREYVVEVGLPTRRKSPNRVRVFEDRLEAISSNPTSKWNKRTKDDILTFARLAIESPKNTCSIQDPHMKPGFMGSFVCTVLALLPYFKYDYFVGDEGDRGLIYDGTGAPLKEGLTVR